jgi:hypothetical protein
MTGTVGGFTPSYQFANNTNNNRAGASSSNTSKEQFINKLVTEYYIPRAIAGNKQATEAYAAQHNITLPPPPDTNSKFK